MSNYWIARIHLYRGLQLSPVEPANSLISAGFTVFGRRSFQLLTFVLLCLCHLDSLRELKTRSELDCF